MYIYVTVLIIEKAYCVFKCEHASWSHTICRGQRWLKDSAIYWWPLPSDTSFHKIAIPSIFFFNNIDLLTKCYKLLCLRRTPSVLLLHTLMLCMTCSPCMNKNSETKILFRPNIILELLFFSTHFSKTTFKGQVGFTAEYHSQVFYLDRNYMSAPWSTTWSQ